MTKFIQVHSPTDNRDYYINVEMVVHVQQHQQRADHSSIRSVGDQHPLPIGESAASFVSRAGAD